MNCGCLPLLLFRSLELFPAMWRQGCVENGDGGALLANEMCAKPSNAASPAKVPSPAAAAAAAARPGCFT